MEDSGKLAERIMVYREELKKLIPYLPWLESKAGASLSSNFAGNDIEKNSISFPIYDGTLMNFVKVASASGFMNRNYVYDYRKHRLMTAKDELQFIAKAELKDMGVLASILSAYIMKGRIKGTKWTEGVTNGVYYHLLSKMKEIVEFWDKPITGR